MNVLNPGRVVITGVGCCSPLGNWRDFKLGLREGRSGVKRVSLLSELGMSSQVAGLVDDSLIASLREKRNLKNSSRAALIAISAAAEAVKQSGLDISRFSEEEIRKTCVLVGSGGGGVEIMEKGYELFFSEKRRKINPFSVPASLVGMLSSELSIYFGFQGLSYVITSGCTSSSDAVGQAFGMIRTGAVRRVLAGGVDACVTPGVVTGFERMGVISRGNNAYPKRASRPFSKDRDGFVLGEGGWFFMLENHDDAVNRGSSILAELLGYSGNCEASHRVRVEEDGAGPLRAMKDALKDAGIKKEEVSYVSLHGTATRLNDVVETKAVRSLFGNISVPGSSPKSMLGHPQGASGAMGIAAALAGMEDGFFPPTINLDHADPDCDLDYVANVARPGEIDVALCNCIGFGSRNAAVVLRRIL